MTPGDNDPLPFLTHGAVVPGIYTKGLFKITIAERGLDRMQFIGCNSIPLGPLESLTMDSQILI